MSLWNATLGSNWLISLCIYLLKVNNRNTRIRCEISSKLTIKIPERRHWRRSSIFIFNSEHISHLLIEIDNFEQVIPGWVTISDKTSGEKNCVEQIKTLKKELYGPFLWIGLNYLQAAEALQGDSSLLTAKSPGVLDTHLIDFRKT